MQFDDIDVDDDVALVTVSDHNSHMRFKTQLFALFSLNLHPLTYYGSIFSCCSVTTCFFSGSAS